jgi:CRISPR-associated protein Cmr5
MPLEQFRSQTAWTMAQEGVAAAGKKYVNLAKAAPALIMNNGLMQTLAFLESKGEPHHQILGQQLRRWVFHRAGGPDRDPGFNPLMTQMVDFDSTQYRQASEEALVLLRWIRQFAAALGGK